MPFYTESPAIVNPDHATRQTCGRAKPSDWMIGYDLYADSQPIAACANNAQRRGWLDAQAGERASAILDTAAAFGYSAEAADYVLANGGW